MSFLLPPYRKLHIILLGTVTLIAYLILLLMIGTTSQSHSVQTVKTTANSLQQDFKQPLSLAQAGRFDTALTQKHFLIIDIRSADDYQKGHIEGALSTPITQLNKATFAPGITVVLYGLNANDIQKAIGILNSQAIQQIQLLNEPLSSLKNSGYVITEPS